MLNTKKLLSLILKKLYVKGSVTANTVTWTYRKYLDGTLEMWGTATTELAINRAIRATASGPITFYQTPQDYYTVAMPSFVSSVDFFTAELTGGGIADVIGMANPPTIRLYSPVSLGSTPRFLRYYLIGKWS